MQAKREYGRLSDTLQEAMAEILVKAPYNVESKTLVDTLAPTLPEERYQRLRDTLGNVQLEKRVQTLANTLPLVRA